MFEILDLLLYSDATQILLDCSQYIAKLAFGLVILFGVISLLCSIVCGILKCINYVYTAVILVINSIRHPDSTNEPSSDDSPNDSPLIEGLPLEFGDEIRGK